MPECLLLLGLWLTYNKRSLAGKHRFANYRHFLSTSMIVQEETMLNQKLWDTVQDHQSPCGANEQSQDANVSYDLQNANGNMTAHCADQHKPHPGLGINCRILHSGVAKNWEGAPCSFVVVFNFENCIMFFYCLSPEEPLLSVIIWLL